MLWFVLNYKCKGEELMKIALINENSQCSKNELIYNTLTNVAKDYGHTVLNFGTYGPEDETQLT